MRLASTKRYRAGRGKEKLNRQGWGKSCTCALSPSPYLCHSITYMFALQGGAHSATTISLMSYHKNPNTR